jgi:hypothetical protein
MPEEANEDDVEILTKMSELPPPTFDYFDCLVHA